MQDIQLSKNFHLSELIVSDKAARMNVDNTPSAQIIERLRESATNLWQPARDILGKPISVSSGYRNPTVNRLVGGASNSAHMSGYAIDFICPGFGTPRDIVNHLSKVFKAKGIKWDQMIWEYGRWVHLSWKAPNGRQRCQVFDIS